MRNPNAKYKLAHIFDVDYVHFQWINDRVQVAVRAQYTLHSLLEWRLPRGSRYVI